MGVFGAFIEGGPKDHFCRQEVWWTEVTRMSTVFVDEAASAVDHDHGAVPRRVGDALD